MKNWNSEDILYIMKSDRAVVSVENIRDINL